MQSSPEHFGALVWIDEGPVRARYMADITRLEDERLRLTQKIERFTKIDKPAFEHWVRSTFAKLHKKLHSLLDEMARLQSIVIEVRQQMRHSRISEEEAYREVIARRERGERPPWESDPEWSFEDEMYREVFTDSLRSEGFTREESEQIFEQLKSEGSFHESSRARAKKSESVKELYRWLVKHLHPDLNPTAQDREIWLEVQEAYAAGDRERLAAIRSRVEMNEHHSGQDRQSLWGLMTLVKAVRASLRPLRKEIKKLKKDIAWEFSKAAHRESHRHAMANQLQDEIAEIHFRVRLLRQQIEEWSEAS